MFDNTKIMIAEPPCARLIDMWLFKGLNDDECVWLNERCAIRTFNKGDYVKRPGEPCSYVYVMKQGRVKGGINSDQGKEFISMILNPPDMFGLLSILPNANSDFFYQTLEESTIGFIKTEDMKRLLQRNAQLSYQVLSVMGQRLLEAESKNYGFVFTDIKGRLVNFLVYLARHTGQRIGDEILVRHNLTQQEMANIVGTTRQTVTTFFSELKTKNIIHVVDCRKFLIRGISLLEEDRLGELR